MEYLEDKDIIELFIARDERAITETIRKYNSRLHGRVMYILNNIEDAEECLQDTYFTLWEKVAEEKPGHLENYIFTIAKFIACSKLRKRLAKKRYVPLTVIGEDYPSSSRCFFGNFFIRVGKIHIRFYKNAEKRSTDDNIS